MMKIEELILETSSIEQQYEFYTQILNVKVIEKSATSFSIKAGTSILTFKYNNNAKTYHFAFNIPANKIEEALCWLKERVVVMDVEGKPIADFKAWNAVAIYFYDKANNIVEFIARKNLEHETKQRFDSSQILNISEIGMPTSNIELLYSEINKIKKIAIFDGDFDRFCALGDEEGLFILIDKHKKKWYPQDDIVYSSPFEIKGTFNFKFNGEKIESTL